jgi:hypothetical protein
MKLAAPWALGWLFGGFAAGAVRAELHLPEQSVSAGVSEGGTERLVKRSLQPIEGAEVVARVGGEVVLAADVLQGWEGFLAANGERIPPSELDRVRTEYMKRQFHDLLDTKFLYSDARRRIPAENFPKIEESLSKKFDEEQLEKLYRSTQTRSPVELDAKLRHMGTTLEQRKRNFVETVLARQWLYQQIEQKGDIPFVKLWSYYQEHLDEFKHPARARWEEIMIRFDRCGDRFEAYRRLATLGNLVLADPSRFGEIARQHSHGVTAEVGGKFDWTTEGSLVATAVDQAIFQLPIGALSQPILSDTGFHIIRVLERTPAGCKPFEEAQAEIRERIMQQARQEKFDEYLAQLRKNVPVWSIFDEAPAAALGQRSETADLR